MNNQLLSNIRSLIDAARKSVARQVDSTMTFTYFLVGRYIVEDEQQGEERAGYAQETLKFLSEELAKEFGRGFSVDNLQNMRTFYLTYKEQPKVASFLQAIGIYEKSSRISDPSANDKELNPIYEKPSRIFTPLSAASGFQNNPFRLSWSHYVMLCRMKNDDERSFYEIEAEQNNWTIKELKRQFDSSIYERLALSRDKNKVKELAEKGQLIENPADAIRNPYVLEFLGLREESAYSESDLESAIISKLEHFMLELGKGFLFSGRQVRFTFGEDHFFVDLVFYNRLLRCFVLIDLKIGKIKHQDIGQMQMYVNYYDRMVKTADENKTIGIIICKDKNDAMVEITLPENNQQIFASQYQLYLPSKEELRLQVIEPGSNPKP